MVDTALSAKTQIYLLELVRRGVISEAGLLDQMFMNHLKALLIDEDYLRGKRTSAGINSNGSKAD